MCGFADPRIRWLDLPKAPYFGRTNRNVALRQATGEFVAVLGHDDLWLPDHLVRLAEEMARAKAEWAERLRTGASRLIEQRAWSCLNGELHVRRECEALVQALTRRVNELSARAPQPAAGAAKGIWRVSPIIR